MREKKYDVLIIGGGPAGYYCALVSSRGGLRVGLVEKEELGGSGFRWGSLPVKRILDDCKLSKSLNTHHKKSSKKTIYDYSNEMKQIEIKIKNKLLDEKVDLYFGEGEFLDNHAYQVKDTLIKSNYIVIATGTSPCGLKDFQIDGKKIITHRDVFNLAKLPEKILIVGGNVEGCEFATLFTELGLRVTLIERESEILPGTDRDLVKPLGDYFKNHGVEIYTGVEAKTIRVSEENKATVFLDNGLELGAEKILITGSRKPNFPKGLNKTGLHVEKTYIPVDEVLGTNIPNIYAIGDINGLMGMAHAAIQQGIVLAENILFKKKSTLSYDIIPSAIFGIPEIAGVGYQEFELKRKNIKYKKGICNFSDTWRGFSKQIANGFIKVLADEDNKLLGVWMVGDNVSEYVGLMSVLIQNKVGLEEIKRNLIIHPSLNEAILEAILSMT